MSMVYGSKMNLKFIQVYFILVFIVYSECTRFFWKDNKEDNQISTTSTTSIPRIVDRCWDYHPIIRNERWKDLCQKLNKECSAVNNVNPTCGPCKDGFKPGPTPVHACTGSCDIIKEGSLTWSSFCATINRICQIPKNESLPQCCECMQGYVNDSSGQCVEVATNVSCPRVYPPEKGISQGNCTDAQPGDRCLIECQDGFVSRGSTTLTCGDDGAWDHPTPICAEKKASDPCQEERSNGISWGAFCYEAGAICGDSGTRTLCQCEESKYFDGIRCADMSPCGKKHSPGKSWNSYCNSIGGACTALLGVPQCACHREQIIQDGTCKEVTACMKLKVDGTVWNQFCRDAEGYCISVGGYPACTCPSGQTFIGGMCSSVNIT